MIDFLGHIIVWVFVVAVTFAVAKRKQKTQASSAAPAPAAPQPVPKPERMQRRPRVAKTAPAAPAVPVRPAVADDMAAYGSLETIPDDAAGMFADAGMLTGAATETEAPAQWHAVADEPAEAGAVEAFDLRKAVLYAEILKPKYDE